MTAGALAGVTVLEVGVFMAAPFATIQLADLGADGLKVESPDGGEPVRSTEPFIEGHSSPFLRLNRSKRSVALPTSEVVARLDRLGVPCPPIADFGEVLTDEHLNSRDFFWDAPHPVAGPVRRIGSPMRLSRTPPRRAAAGPALGADTRAALREAGYTDEDVDALVAARAVREAS